MLVPLTQTEPEHLITQDQRGLTTFFDHGLRFKVCRGACRFCNRELAAAHYADAMGGMSESLHHCPAVAYAERTSPESLPLYRSGSRQMELVAELLDVHRSRPHDES